jgi:hypothetical protein
MDNPYFTTVNPYFQQLSPKDEASLSPTFQNIGAQQAMQNAALKEQNQQVQQAGMIGKQGNQNQMALAMALRNQNNDPYFQAQQAMKQYGQGNVYGYGGQGQVPMGGTGFD